MKFIKKFLYPIFFLAILISIFFIPELIKITKIECSSQFGPCSTFIEESLLKYEKSSFKKAKKEISTFLSSQNQIGSYSLRFKLPSTLSVLVLEKKARFAIFDKEKEIFATVEENGEILALFNETNLPYVEFENLTLNTGEKVTKEAQTALFLQERIFSSYQVRSGEVKGEALVVILPEGYTVLFPLDRDHEELMGALSLILSALKGSSEASKIDVGINVKTIDLRFKNPVLK